MPQDKISHYEPCPVARCVDVIGDRWSLLIVRDIMDGKHRFGDLQRSLNVARNILSNRLHKLIDAEILELQGASDGTAYQEYILTDQGKQLFPVIVALRQWGEQHLFGKQEPHSILIEKSTQKPVPLMRLTSSEGDSLDADTTEVLKVNL
ncbi:helix-turn-helix transcriptional regulator [Acinetobacter sp. C26M]|uniref:winged helix-turn-helix transcriptional regulator n=1 Tax=unclassified Acinetobacter TaxID=196816 RepID=UPI002036BD8B|nr:MULTISPECIES: helix-turn-helix domain-containing protein [unclassified Acinetobacter]USA45356.1 helix-turn-helix transcriptional regulator [Acinetobacter sp. C26M]USA48858.1 helix-turn-helix transcriptional regulator [Acinetobacter sp. C26G]